MVVDTFQGALPAVLPFLKDNLNLSYTMAGMILIIANISSSVIQPFFGMLSDKKEKAFLLPLGAFLAGAGFCLLPLARNYGLVLLLVAISGMGIASYHPEGFKTARFFTGQRMATGMSVFSVGGNAGMALGPILALSIIHYRGFSSLGWMAVLPAAFRDCDCPASPDRCCAELRDTFGSQGQNPGLQSGLPDALRLSYALIIIRTWIMFGLMTYIPFYYINYLKGDPVFAGKLVSLFLIGGAVGTLAGSPLADRWGHLFWLRFSMLGCALLFPFILWLQGFALLCDCYSIRTNPYFHFFRYCCHGTEPVSAQYGSRIGSAGRLRYRSRRNRGDPSGRHGGSFRGPCGDEVHRCAPCCGIPADYDPALSCRRTGQRGTLSIAVHRTGRSPRTFDELRRSWNAL